MSANNTHERRARRVALLHPAFDGPGGAEDNVVVFARALSQSGWLVEIICSRWNPSAFEGKLDDFTPRLIPMPRKPSYRHLDSAALKALEEAIRDCSIAMAHNYPASTYLGWANTPIARLWYCQEPHRRLHAVETSPGLQRGIATGKLNPHVEGNRELQRKLRLTRWKRRLNPRLRARRAFDIAGVRRLDAVWANSLETARQVESLYGRSADVQYMGVRVPDRLPTPVPIEGLMRVLTMGGFGAVKGFGRLLAGFAQFCRDQPPGAILEVVGRGADQAAFEARVSDLGLADRVHFHGRLLPQDLVKLRARCHAFAALPVDEPFGLVFAEAAAAGLVLLVPDHGGPRETAMDGKGGILVDIFDTDAVAKAFAHLVALSDSDRESLRRTAFEGVRTRFNVADLGDRLNHGLETLLSRR
jgi:glycosyltransferase involved in cell wall biosynthesis